MVFKGGKTMNKVLKMKVIVCLILTVIIITVLQVFSFANNESIQILKKSENEYMIYILGVNEEFEFAFTNTSNVADKTTLEFKESALDQLENGNHIAYVDSEIYTEYFEGKTNTYLWVKQNETYKIEAKEIVLTDSISEDDIQFLNNVTNRIKVKYGKKQLPTETIDGVEITRSIGTINIDDEPATYKYKMDKSVEGSDVEKLIKIAEQEMNEETLSNKTIFEKLSIYNEFKKIYESLVPDENAQNWEKTVVDNTIDQPIESKTGDQYLVWIRKDLGNGNVTIDVQIMTCKDEYVQEHEKRDVVIKETTKLPITGDSIILFVIAGIILILIVTVVTLKVKNKNKK